MIYMSNMNFQYKGSKEFALQDINLQIHKGDFVGIIGNSGAGKTTLAGAINGMVPHHFRGDFYGEVTVNGLDTVDVRPEELSRFVGSVFQDVDAQMVASIVEDEILFGLENFKIPKQEIEDRLAWALKTVGIESLRYRSIDSLSGGQKQKVAIAAIVALKPEILVLDEPTGELDPVSSRQIFSLLQELNETLGTTIVIIEQKVMLLCEFAHRLLVMEKGKILYDDRTREVLKYSKELLDIGINVPRIVTLSEELAIKGYQNRTAPINLAEAQKMVEEVLQNA